MDELEDTKPETPLDPALVDEWQHPKAVLKAALRSDVGAVREKNEDSCLMFSSESGGHFRLAPFGLYLVADGMGGHQAGEIASKTAARVAGHYILENLYLPLVNTESPPNGMDVQARLEQAVRVAHEAVHQPDPLQDGGTTLTVAVVLGRELHIAHVGDSRAYWLVDGKLEALTNDHSLVQRLQDEGQLTPEEALHYQYRNVLLRALGQEDDLEVDTYFRSMPQRGKLLLCSDGLSGLVPGAQLQDILGKDHSPQDTVNQLIGAALDAGGYDNITALVVDFRY